MPFAVGILVGCGLAALALARVYEGQLATERSLTRLAEAQRDAALRAVGKACEVNAQLNAENARLADNLDTLGRQLSGWSSLPRKERRWQA